MRNQPRVELRQGVPQKCFPQERVFLEDRREAIDGRRDGFARGVARGDEVKRVGDLGEEGVKGLKGGVVGVEDEVALGMKLPVGEGSQDTVRRS